MIPQEHFADERAHQRSTRFRHGRCVPHQKTEPGRSTSPAFFVFKSDIFFNKLDLSNDRLLQIEIFERVDFSNAVQTYIGSFYQEL